MRKIITSIILSAIAFTSFAQIITNQKAEYIMQPNEKYTEIDILSGYYSQDGENGAVTGGIGTESLQDFANLIVINVPIDSSKSINFSGGVDIYSSASTDNIDNNRSSASSMDARSYANLGYNQKFLHSGFTVGGRLGFSTEYDYNSINGGINIAKEFNEGNTEFSFSGQAFIDNWDLIYPIELRGKVSAPTSSRNSFNGQLTWSQVVSPRFQFSVSGEAIYMDGLLSTPFHRVYFSDTETPDIERLPSKRLKLPFALRLNYIPLDQLIFRGYYRYYSDDFGIVGHTASLEIPYHISDEWSVYPFFRYHTQTGSDYFAPYKEHLSSQEFYTSDYDLSELNSSKYGVGISYSPVFGVFRSKLPFNQLLMMNTIAFRGARYVRSTGLSGYSFSLELGFRI